MKTTTLFLIVLFLFVNMTALVSAKKLHGKAHKAHTQAKAHKAHKKSEKACLGGQCQVVL
jgi:hypothetical protein